MSARRWGVFYTNAVKEFRKSLSPAEIETFNECVMRIYRDPRADGIRKFPFRSRPPLVDYVYQDYDFVLIYLWAQLDEPFGTYRVEITQAARARDFDKDSTIPRR